MLSALLPSMVSACDAFDDAPEDVLFPEERQAIAGAVARRRTEFATVRALARTAMARSGFPPSPLIPDRRGAPQWPRGVVGSMTHCPGYRAAVVASAFDVAALGIDAEPNRPMPRKVTELICLASEQELIAQLSYERPDICYDRLVLSIKETVFKAWYQATRHELEFQQIEVNITETSAFDFALRLPVAAPDPSWFHGNRGIWSDSFGRLTTALVVLPNLQRCAKR
jgi:4'-phosphopantetheinyl transferase EntD